MGWKINELPRERSPEVKRAYAEGFKAAIGMATEYSAEGKPLTTIQEIATFLIESTNTPDNEPERRRIIRLKASNDD